MDKEFISEMVLNGYGKKVMAMVPYSFTTDFFPGSEFLQSERNLYFGDVKCIFNQLNQDSRLEVIAPNRYLMYLYSDHQQQHFQNLLFKSLTYSYFGIDPAPNPGDFLYYNMYDYDLFGTLDLSDLQTTPSVNLEQTYPLLTIAHAIYPGVLFSASPNSVIQDYRLQFKLTDNVGGVTWFQPSIPNGLSLGSYVAASAPASQIQTKRSNGTNLWVKDTSAGFEATFTIFDGAGGFAVGAVADNSALGYTLEGFMGSNNALCNVPVNFEFYQQNGTFYCNTPTGTQEIITDGLTENYLRFNTAYAGIGVKFTATQPDTLTAVGTLLAAVNGVHYIDGFGLMESFLTPLGQDFFDSQNRRIIQQVYGVSGQRPLADNYLDMRIQVQFNGYKITLNE